MLHIARNPFDNIASIARNRELPVAQAIEIYRDLGLAVDEVRAKLAPDELHDVTYESFLREPSDEISAILSFIGVGASAEYLSSCASLVDDSGHRGRGAVEWSADERGQVEEMAVSRPVLAGYRFED